MFIVTALGRRERAAAEPGERAAAQPAERGGCLIGFATQCSIHPPRFIACISKENRTFDVVAGADSVVVHFLGPEQRELAVLFGGETGDEVDKFQLCGWHEGPDRIPVLDGVPGWFAGRVLDRLDLGDHVGLWLEPTAAEDRDGTVNLGFQDVKSVDPGHPA
jgi:flavin reductase (DIM6/NTAB) family NADH-FMN oxidoreductase RutF